MSLINDMLRNLEANRPDDPARQNLQREIRSLPAAAPTGRRILRVFLLAGLPALGLLAAWLQANDLLLPGLGIHPEAVPVAVVAPIPAQPEPVRETPAPAAPAPDSDALKPASELAAVPVIPVAPVLPVPDPVVLPPAAPAAKAEAEASKPAAAPATSGPVKIEKNPVLATPRDQADAEYRKAEAALGAGRSGEATDLLRAALKADPGYVAARQALLRQLLDGRKFEEAAQVLQDGLDLQPAQVGWAMSLARLQLEQGDLAAADRTLARFQSHAESNPDYAAFQGHLKTRLGAHRQAVAHYQRATRLAPGEGRWWLGLGLALEADGRVAESKEALRRALATGTLSNELSSVAEQHLRG